MNYSKSGSIELRTDAVRCSGCADREINQNKTQVMGLNEGDA